MTLFDDYSGPFRPGLDLTDLSRCALAVLGREWMLHGHLQDRLGMPLVLAAGGSREDMQEIAIDEWMGASPVYSRRTQRALGFGGQGVATILKNVQLDIGAPHQFLDFRCVVHDERNGEFWLDHCGALMDVEPMGEEFVHGMCHTIEDPTFDATAVAADPRAQIRPIHRPPRVPADRSPHCHWTVKIPDDGEPAQPHPNVTLVSRSKAAAIAVVDPGADAEPGGWADYSGPLDIDFCLEDLSHRALVVTLQELAVQSHLVLRSFLLAVSQRFGEEAAAGLGPQILAGLGGLTAQRLRAAMAIRDGGPVAIAKVLQLHPLFYPRSYVHTAVELEDGDRVRLAFGDSAVFEEDDGRTWFAQLGGAADAALGTIAAAVDPQARCTPVPPDPGERFAYEIVVDPSAPPVDEPLEMALVKISSGAAFEFETRRPLRV